MTSALDGLTDTDLHETLAQIWLSYLDPATAPVPAWEPIAEDEWAAQVRVCAAADITGAWRGTVTVEMGLELAFNVAAALYAQPVAAVSGDLGRAEQSLLFDAVGEVVNIVAGNLKALLPQPSVLSLPRVEFLAAAPPRLTGEVAALPAAPDAGALVVDLLCADQPIRLTLRTRDRL